MDYTVRLSAVLIYSISYILYFWFTAGLSTVGESSNDTSTSQICTSNGSLQKSLESPSQESSTKTASNGGLLRINEPRALENRTVDLNTPKFVLNPGMHTPVIGTSEYALILGAVPA